MSVIDNLNLINSYKSDIKQAINDKGVDMTNIPLSGYAGKIGEIETGGTPDPLTVTSNGTYTAETGGYSPVVVDVPQSVTGYTMKEWAEGIDNTITELVDSTITYVRMYGFYIGLHDNGQIDKRFTKLQKVDLPNCTYVGDYAFKFCSALTSINLPLCENVYGSAFTGAAITTLSLPVCTSIGIYAFKDCSSLTDVNLPACTTIASYAFMNCTNLTTITLSVNKVCSLSNANAFNSCSNLTTIYVPSDLVDSYKAASNWSSYADKIVAIPE